MQLHQDRKSFFRSLLLLGTGTLLSGKLNAFNAPLSIKNNKIVATGSPEKSLSVVKKLTIVFSGLILIIILSCNKPLSPATFTPNCGGGRVSFSKDVNLLILNNCAYSGCHDAGSFKGPGALTTYVQDSMYSAYIRSDIVSGRMPKGGALTDAQKDSIICWIDAGAPNN